MISARSPFRPPRPPKRRSLAWAVAACAAAVLAVAGCSSSPSSSSPGSAAPSGVAATGSSSSSPASAVAGSTYTIGTIASITGPYAASIGGTPSTVTAWVSWTNAHGGVNGHPVKDIVLDDASVPSKGIADAKELIGDHVSAIVGSASNTESSWYQLVTKAGIPVVGGQVNGGALYQTVPGLYPTGTTSTLPALDLAKKAGKLKIAVLYCSEVPICAAQAQTLKSALSAAAGEYPGMNIVYSAAIAGAAPSYTAQCLAAQQAGADALVMEEGASVTLRVVDNCATEGFKPTLLGTGAEADDTWLKDPNFNGVQVYQPNFPWIADATAAQREFQDALKQYAPSELSSVTYNPADAQTWASLEVFKAAVDQARPAALTTSAVEAAVTALPAGFSVDSITPPLTFKKGSPNPNVNCYFLVQIENGKYTVRNNGKDTCPAGS